ncbi:hypothetical protein IDSA_08950 [Pseudidiomarina salinarum]|uniref:Aminotransferase class V domain-containing protein n=1 Tax=Pseudidiomarina salinarum TaxID=435908 RepID=A0A094IXU1_9GAMM|nr:aminotransferase class V-fold PLP-dependent enzyme [Pseudidiomarina salinarum]KFZ30649.1 hypothetical protein IDSA_08950 [Pseudidiomarina salinarum]RUO69161.1 aminotransferase class V-fold PLP-dependent enzyme [Pseudidiomarina salinarum]
MKPQNKFTRRQFLTMAAAVPVATAFGYAAAHPMNKLLNPGASETAGLKPEQLREFGPLQFVQGDEVNFNAGSSHPLSLGALQTVQDYFNSRAHLPQAEGYKLPASQPIEQFAQLVNADPSELTYVQSTTTGEQMVLRALNIPHSGGHIITDTLHFFGSLPMYRELERQGMEVTFIRDENGQISPEAIRDAIRPDTKLIALSLVSTVNGFTHDLKTICDYAHQKGVYVYADIIHAAGCMPLDLHHSGVDFAATASYKWLMGDFGLGFIYAAKHTHDKLRQGNYGYYGISEYSSHNQPHDPPGEHVVEYAFADDARGLFALGTRQHAVIAQLSYSLQQLLDIGVDKVQQHAQLHTRHLKQQLPKLGFELYTPEGSEAPLVTCIYKDARKKLAPLFKERGLNLTVSRNSFRVSVSVFNTPEDTEHLLRTLRDHV